MIGSGLAGLSAALQLASQDFDVLVLEARPCVGGRTASWNEKGMEVESGLHRILGFYTEFPKLVKKAGLKMKDVVIWEDELEIKVANGSSFVYGTSPIFKPLKTFSSPFRNRLISWSETWKVFKFMVSGMMAWLSEPEKLDEISTLDYAARFHLDEKTIQRLIVPLTAGLFFLPPSKYSAYVFFGPFVHALKRFYRMRIGAFRGEMTDVLAGPIGKEIIRLGGTIMTGTPVAKLLITDNRIRSVEVSSGKDYPCDYVILAASLGPAQQLIRASSLEAAFTDMLALQYMPEVNLQIEFTRRAWPVDRTVFGVGTSLITFAEQSRTTFHHKPGRLSIILTPPERIIGLKDEEIFEIFRQESTMLGIDASRVTGYRVVRHPDDFYLLGPGMNKLRPKTRTSVGGLFLAGDYVRQSLMATMEGAVIAGNNAAREVSAAGRSGD